MSVDACASLVERGDPDRFRTALTAPQALRGRLMVLYAFNLEVVRAPWVTQEAMIAEMRLQWWVDALEEIAGGQPPRRHEVVTPLAALIAEAGLPVATLSALVAARRRDIYPEPPDSRQALWTYLDATSGGLVAVAAQALGAPAATVDTARTFGQAMGAANLLRAFPVLRAQNRSPLPAGDEKDEIRALVADARGRLETARRARADVPVSARAAFLAGWQTGPVLARAGADPARVAAGDLEASEARQRLSLAWAALTGRW